jgi:hypothetical protein
MVNSYGLAECADWVEQASGLALAQGRCRAKKAAAGSGLACSHYISGVEAGERTGEPHATIAQARFRWLDRAATGAAEIGQVLRRLVQTVSEVPGLDSRACDRKATAKWCQRTTAPTARHLHGRQRDRRCAAAQDRAHCGAARKPDAAGRDRTGEPIAPARKTRASPSTK